MRSCLLGFIFNGNGNFVTGLYRAWRRGDRFFAFNVVKKILAFGCFSVLLLSQYWLCLSTKTPTLQCVMTNRFCVFVLFDYHCDLDHDSKSNTQTNKQTSNILFLKHTHKNFYYKHMSQAHRTKQIVKTNTVKTNNTFWNVFNLICRNLFSVRTSISNSCIFLLYSLRSSIQD